MPSQSGVLSNARELVIAVVCLIVAGTTLLWLCSFIPGVWTFDLLSQFRLIWVLILGVCATTLVLLRSFAPLIVSVVLLIVASIPIATMYVPRTYNDPSAREESFSVLNFNTEFQHNDKYKLFAELISQKQPDVIVIVETNKVWMDELTQATNDYKYRDIVIEGPGMALFSKYPIVSSNVSYYGKSHHPRISAVLKLKHQNLNLMVAHPTTPKTSSGYRERNRELKLLGDELRTLRDPKMLVADLNCGPWSAEFSKLLGAGLYDSQRGFGPQPSWPARVGRVMKLLPVPPLVPIDHVLVSKNIFVLERVVGPSIGSDHLPVFARLKLKSTD